MSTVTQPATVKTWHARPPATNDGYVRTDDGERLEKLSDSTWRISLWRFGRRLGGRLVPAAEAAKFLACHGHVDDREPPADLAEAVAALEV